MGFQGNALNRTPQSAKLSRLQSAFSLFASFSLPQDEKEKKKVGSPSGDRQLGACLVVIVRQGSMSVVYAELGEHRLAEHAFSAEIALIKHFTIVTE